MKWSLCDKQNRMFRQYEFKGIWGKLIKSIKDNKCNDDGLVIKVNREMIVQ